ncbi:HAD family hydrolase [Solicola gregarius]|uniref:HAD family hydrolase n=1 Tax=Solicola gregarius TaxID=2908642 RepID=A0AA46TGM0_9ACTN|nr:HAD family hydrolase [Solicola gregarius]UYM04474.1 HAD family hydrolase [Solicola gregarius]
MQSRPATSSRRRPRCSTRRSRSGRARDEHRSATFDDICTLAGVPATADAVAAYRAFWEPSTVTDPDAGALFESLRAVGIKVGVLSNTVWPRAWHEQIFARDGVHHLIDGDVYTCEIDWTKPDPRAFEAAMAAIGADTAASCAFVGDRLFDDIWGAASVGMRTIHVPHSTIPADQLGHAVGEPDAVVQRLSEVANVVEHWNRPR